MELIGFDVVESSSVFSFLNRYGNITGGLTAVMCGPVTLVGGIAAIHAKATQNIGVENDRNDNSPCLRDKSCKIIGFFTREMIPRGAIALALAHYDSKILHTTAGMAAQRCTS